MSVALHTRKEIWTVTAWMKTIYYLNILLTKAFKLEITYHPHILIIHIMYFYVCIYLFSVENNRL